MLSKQDFSSSCFINFTESNLEEEISNANKISMKKKTKNSLSAVTNK